MAQTDETRLITDGPELAETGLVHRYRAPAGPGPYPTAVLLHGRYGNEDVMWIFRRALPHPYFQIAPRGILPEYGARYSWLHQPTDYWPDLADFREPIERMAHFLRALPRLYNTDPDRTYLMGFSQGAAVAIGTALAHPDLVRGVAVLVGFAPTAPPEVFAGQLAGLPVFMAVGTEDERVPLAQSHHSADFLRRAGARLLYHEYETGHKLTADGVRDLTAWWQDLE